MIINSAPTKFFKINPPSTSLVYYKLPLSTHNVMARFHMQARLRYSIELCYIIRFCSDENELLLKASFHR